MNIGELFLNLGIKGTEKTVGALSSVKKGLGDVGSMSLEAKAGILAAMYALERLVATSGAVGTSLTNFTAETGIAAKTLQQYQFAARQMGVANEDTANTFIKLQNAMSGAAMGKAPPAGMAQLATAVGGIKENYNELAKNPEKLFQYLQTGAQRIKNIGLRNQVLGSFGLSDSMIAAMSRNAFNPQAFAKAPSYGDKEISSLDRANIAWSNLGTKISMAFGHLNAKHGGELVADFTTLTNALIKLADALLRLAEVTHIFQGIAKMMNLFADGVTDTMSHEKVLSGLRKGKFEGKEIKKTDSFSDALMSILKGQPILPQSTTAAPNMPATQPVAGSTQNIEVNQNLNFQHDGKDHKRTSDSVKQAIQHSYRQMSAQGQGS